MNCFNCQATLSDADFCAGCGIDVAVYKKILRLSNHYYNVGLEKASVRDLSGAITALKRSLKYNKENIQARNLLGLVYYEMGETVKALGEWVISKSMRSNDNIADGYLKAIQSNQGRLDAVNQTIKKYNQALTYCRQQSEDLAIIQLKKVLSLNPKLIQGHQLIALLYMKQGEWERARKALNTALKIDTNNTTTLRYLKEVKEQMTRNNPNVSKKKSDKVSYNSGNDIVIQPTGFKDFSGISVVINILIGILIGGCVVWFLVVPALNQSAKSDASKALIEANEQIASKNATISGLESEVEAAKQEVQKAQENTQASQDIISSYEQLAIALEAYYNQDKDTAAQAFRAVNPEYLSDSTKVIYEAINAVINQELLESLYNEGYTAYNQTNYETAVEKLEQVVQIDESYNNGYAVYYLAQSYRKVENIEKAIEMYQRVIELIPGTDRARTSQQHLDELQTEVDQNQENEEDTGTEDTTNY